MPISARRAPEGGREVPDRAISWLYDEPAEVDSPAAAISPNEDIVGPGLATAAPHRVYVVGPKEVGAGRLLAGARAQGWRYLLLRDEEVVGTVTFQPDADTGELVFSHVTDGPFVAATVEGIQVAERIPEVAAGDFELRLLDAPALHLRSLWLHSDDRNFLIPLAPAPPPVEAYRVYSEIDLRAVLQNLAVERPSYAEEVGG